LNIIININIIIVININNIIIINIIFL